MSSKTRILWLGRNLPDLNTRAMPSLRAALSKSTRLTLYTTKDIVKLPKESSYDLVIIGPIRTDLSEWAFLSKWKIPKVMICSDPQSDIAYHKFYSRKYGVDLALLACGNWIPFYGKHLKCDLGWLPFCIDDIMVRTYKDVNLSYSVSDSPFYPIRFLMKRDKRLYKFSRVSFGAEGVRLKKEDYNELLNRSKILAFDNSVWNLPVIKWLEGFSTLNLVMSPTPEYAEMLGFKPYKNFVPITEDDYFEKIEEYSEKSRERVRITNRGRKLFLERHTPDIRVKELLGFINDL